jgi:porin
MKNVALLAISVLLATSTVGAAADLEYKAPAAPSPVAGPQTLTGDWFGQGPAMRESGVELRLEWSQFYQGMTSGQGGKNWQSGGHWDGQGRFDLSKWGLWEGLSVTVQGYWNIGQSVNGNGGSLFPVNSALYFPGIVREDRSDIVALYVQQDFGKLVSVLIGKLNLVEFSRATPLRGGGGVDTFWNVNLATPITGLTPPTIYGAQVRLNTQPVSYSLTVFDSQDATNKPLFDNLFQNGVNIMGTATYKTSIAGLSGSYGIKGLYSNKTGADLSLLIPSAINNVLFTKSGSWYVGLSMQQYLIQDPNNPGRGWGVFGEITKADGNPNTLDWSTYVGIGGSSLIPGRPDDRFGIGYFRYTVSKDLKIELAPIFPLTDESGVELFYNALVAPGVRVTGNLQFIRPASANFPSAIYAGVGTSIHF